MDPNTTLNDLIDAAVAGDARGIRDAAFILIGWLRDGGFAPDDPRGSAALEAARKFAREFKLWVEEDAPAEWDGGSLGYDVGGLYSMAEDVLAGRETSDA